MNYTPTNYKEDRTELIYKIIREYSFATLITHSESGLLISHLPLLLEVYDSRTLLLGHCAKANPQWKQFDEGVMVTVLFHGPHAYISPAWYKPKPDNVPTWNYAKVHVQGSASIISEPTEVYETLQKTVKHFENKYGTVWSLTQDPNEGISELLCHMIAFKIEVKDIQATFKLSQKQNFNDRNNVILN